MLAPKIGTFRFERQWRLTPKRQTIFVPDAYRPKCQDWYVQPGSRDLIEVAAVSMKGLKVHKKLVWSIPSNEDW